MRRHQWCHACWQQVAAIPCIFISGNTDRTFLFVGVQYLGDFVAHAGRSESPAWFMLDKLTFPTESRGETSASQGWFRNDIMYVHYVRGSHPLHVIVTYKYINPPDLWFQSSRHKRRRQINKWLCSCQLASYPFVNWLADLLPIIATSRSLTQIDYGMKMYEAK